MSSSPPDFDYLLQSGVSAQTARTTTRPARPVVSDFDYSLQSGVLPATTQTQTHNAPPTASWEQPPRPPVAGTQNVPAAMLDHEEITALLSLVSIDDPDIKTHAALLANEFLQDDTRSATMIERVEGYARFNDGFRGLFWNAVSSFAEPGAAVSTNPAVNTLSREVAGIQQLPVRDRADDTYGAVQFHTHRHEHHHAHNQMHTQTYNHGYATEPANQVAAVEITAQQSTRVQAPIPDNNEQMLSTRPVTSHRQVAASTTTNQSNGTELGAATPPANHSVRLSGHPHLAPSRHEQATAFRSGGQPQQVSKNPAPAPASESTQRELRPRQVLQPPAQSPFIPASAAVEPPEGSQQLLPIHTSNANLRTAPALPAQDRDAARQVGYGAVLTAVNENRNTSRPSQRSVAAPLSVSSNIEHLRRVHILPFSSSIMTHIVQPIFQAINGRSTDASVAIAPPLDARILCYFAPALHNNIYANHQTQYCILTGLSSQLEHYRHIFKWITDVNAVPTFAGQALPYRYKPCPIPRDLDFHGLTLLRLTSETMGMVELEGRIMERIQAKVADVKWREVVKLMRLVSVHDKSVLAYMQHKADAYSRDSRRRVRIKEAVAECSRVDVRLGEIIWDMVRERKAPVVALGGRLSRRAEVLLEELFRR